MTSKTSRIIFTIPSGSTTSNTVHIPSGSIVGVRFPATMTGTSISFKTANNIDDTPVAHYASTGSLLSLTFVASIVQQINANDTSAMGHYVQIVSNGTEGAERTLYLIVRDLS